MRAYRNNADSSEFVLEKSIFSNVFEKDIRRVYLYKKAERLAKAIHLIGPAFSANRALRERLDHAAVQLIDASTLAPQASREALSRELLALSSILSIARTTGILTPMNADLIHREAQLLLSEVAGYEAPQVEFEEMPSLAALAKATAATEAREASRLRSLARITFDADLKADEAPENKGQTQGHIKDTKGKAEEPRAQEKEGGPSARRERILAVLKGKGPSYIKDISLVVRGVSEKTIQRELASLVSEGLVTRKGDRRWTTYELA